MDKTYGAYAIQALQRTIKDSGLSPDDIDGLMVCPDSAGDTWSAEDRGEARPYFDPPYDTEDGLSGVSADWLVNNLGLKNVKFTMHGPGCISNSMCVAAQAVGDGHYAQVVGLVHLSQFIKPLFYLLGVAVHADVLVLLDEGRLVRRQRSIVKAKLHVGLPCTSSSTSCTTTSKCSF